MNKVEMQIALKLRGSTQNSIIDMLNNYLCKNDDIYKVVTATDFSHAWSLDENSKYMPPKYKWIRNETERIISQWK